MSDTPKGLNQLNRVLLQTLMSKDAANIVADRLEELERENAALRAALAEIEAYSVGWKEEVARKALEASGKEQP